MPTMKRGIFRRIDFEVTHSLKKRFHKSVPQSDPNECWEWQACLRNGYGCIKHEGRALQAHRVAYVLAYGNPSEECVIGHKCDNKKCCNPNHIEAITPAQNNRDAFQRIRRCEIRGEEIATSVLTEELVAKIWELRKGGMSQRKVAEQIGHKYSTVKGVLIGRSWKHCQPLWYKQERGLI